MREQKKYMDIVRLGHKSTQGVFNVGDMISITEKLDGANACFALDDKETDGVARYSRNNRLSVDQTLGGFYGWVTDSIVPIKDMLIPTYRYFGEWMNPHKIKYKPEIYKRFFLFSIWDDEANQYVTDDIVQMEAVRLGLDTVAYMYQGEYISFEHLMSFVGKSRNTLEPDTGEGIVVKSQVYRDRFGNNVFTKLVSDAFREVQQQKPPKDPSTVDAFTMMARTLVTEARVEKHIYKEVDDGNLKEDWNIEDMAQILKLITTKVVDDIYKEEYDMIKDLETEGLRKRLRGEVPLAVKRVIMGR